MESFRNTFDVASVAVVIGTLADRDWVVVKAQEAGEDVPAAWVTYRTALRNLPAATSDPANPTWPDAP